MAPSSGGYVYRGGCTWVKPGRFGSFFRAFLFPSTWRDTVSRCFVYQVSGTHANTQNLPHFRAFPAGIQEHSPPKCLFFMANAKLPNRLPVLPSYRGGVVHRGWEGVCGYPHRSNCKWIKVKSPCFRTISLLNYDSESESERKSLGISFISLVWACCCGLCMPNMIITNANAEENLGELFAFALRKRTAKKNLQIFICNRFRADGSGG